MLRAEGHAINRKRVQQLMRRMGIAALGPKPRMTKPAPGHEIFPYLLRGLSSPLVKSPAFHTSADLTTRSQESDFWKGHGLTVMSRSSPRRHFDLLASI
jgi:hypothetical protein